MDYTDLFKLAGAILTSIGGAAIIIFALSSWLGKVWANRILEKDKLHYQTELEKIKNKLQQESQNQQLIFSMYFEGQFKQYNNLWLALIELESEVNKLWESASRENTRSFLRSIKKAKTQIKNNALLIKKEHYEQIMKNLEVFDQYLDGKNRLLNTNSDNEYQINNLVESNRQNREEILNFINTMLEKMRSQIGGNI